MKFAKLLHNKEKSTNNQLHAVCTFTILAAFVDSPTETLQVRSRFQTA